MESFSGLTRAPFFIAGGFGIETQKDSRVALRLPENDFPCQATLRRASPAFR